MTIQSDKSLFNMDYDEEKDLIRAFGILELKKILDREDSIREAAQFSEYDFDPEINPHDEGIPGFESKSWYSA